MKLFSFPSAMLERAIAKRMLTLEPVAREWFVSRWAQKPYKKAFIEKKAMPLVVLIAKGKNWSDEVFEQELHDWDVKFQPAEFEVLQPIVSGGDMLNLMQKKMPVERLDKILQHMRENLI